MRAPPAQGPAENLCSVYQSCIVQAPGETDRRCPGIVLINTAPLSATAVTPMGRVGEGQGDMVHGLGGEGGGRRQGEIQLEGETLWNGH